MASASNKIPPLHVLRGILRRLKVNKNELPTAQQQVENTAVRRSTSNYVLNRYRKDATDQHQHQHQQQRQPTENSNKSQELRKLAYEYMILRQAVDERSRLQRLDTGAENQLSPREMSRRAAARAGLALPELDPDLK